MTLNDRDLCSAYDNALPHVQRTHGDPQVQHLIGVACDALNKLADRAKVVVAERNVQQLRAATVVAERQLAELTSSSEHE